jgi:hypothetical protein
MPRPRFSLRTLLVLVTMVCCFLGWILWNVKIVHQRQDMRAWIYNNRGGYSTLSDYATMPTYLDDLGLDQPPAVSYLRTMLGDEPIVVIQLLPWKATPAEAEKVRTTFPEALIKMVPVETGIF